MTRILCQGPRGGKPAHPHIAEFCENGAKATAWELTTYRTTPEFFTKHTVTELRGWKDYDLEQAGRLTHPMKYDAATDRYLAVSPKEVPTYDKKPQMSAPDVAFEVVHRLQNYDLVIINFANPDMVGHTGQMEATMQAISTVDSCVGRLMEATNRSSCQNCWLHFAMRMLYLVPDG